MERTRALLIQVAVGDTRSISQQIVDGVRMKIATAELGVGDKLPSVRGLARQLTVNPNTVAKAYAELTSEGWLESRQGLGLYVAKPRQRLSESERERRLDNAVQGLVHEVAALGYEPGQVVQRVDEALSVLQPRKMA